MIQIIVIILSSTKGRTQGYVRLFISIDEWNTSLLPQAGSPVKVHYDNIKVSVLELVELLNKRLSLLVHLLCK